MKNKNHNNLNNVFAILAIVLIVVALLNFGITFVKVSEFRKALTGFATGYINITVATNIGVDISPTWGINWSAGGVNATLTNATLTTYGNASTVIGGNWSTAGVTGILITNTGNTNCSLTINATKNNTDWFGAVTSGPSAYQFNVTNLVAGACTGGNTLTDWKNANHTAIKYCAQFNSDASKNQVWLDVKLQVPYDTPNTGSQTDTLTITAAAAG